MNCSCGTNDWVEVLSKADLNADALKGQWRREGSGVSTLADDASLLRLPIQLQGNYDVEVVFSVINGNHGPDLIVPVGVRPCSVSLFGWGGTIHGLSRIDGRESKDNPTAAQTAGLRNDRRYTLLAQVQVDRGRAGVDALLDGERVIHWSGKESSITPNSCLRAASASRTVLGGVEWKNHLSQRSFANDFWKSLAEPGGEATTAEVTACVVTNSLFNSLHLFCYDSLAVCDHRRANAGLRRKSSGQPQAGTDTRTLAVGRATGSLSLAGVAGRGVVLSWLGRLLSKESPGNFLRRARSVVVAAGVTRSLVWVVRITWFVGAIGIIGSSSLSAPILAPVLAAGATAKHGS